MSKYDEFVPKPASIGTDKPDSNWRKYRHPKPVRDACKRPFLQHPIYVLSYRRASIGGGTVDVLHELTESDRELRDMMHLVVEPDEVDAYQAAHPWIRILALPERFKREYRTLDDKPEHFPKGGGPARNFAMHHAIESGAERHWLLDDNLYGYLTFYGPHGGDRTRFADMSAFGVVEKLVDGFTNMGLASHQYDYFGSATSEKNSKAHFNTRCMSSILVNHKPGIWWSGRYNEDVILSTRMLLKGWALALPKYALVLKKPRSDSKQGGGNSEIYRAGDGASRKRLTDAEVESIRERGSLDKSMMLVREFPDLFSLQRRFGRWHHKAIQPATRNLRNSVPLIRSA